MNKTILQFLLFLIFFAGTGCQKVLQPKQMKEDLDFLFKTIEEVHPNMYAYMSKEEFDPLREKLYQSIDHPMNRLEFYKLVAPVVAKLKSGHMLITPWQLFQEYLQNGGKVFPIELHWDGECVVLNDVYAPIALPAGGTILEINGENAPIVIRRISRYFPAEHRDSNPWIVENPNIVFLCFWLEYGQAESLNLKIKSVDGKISNHHVKAMTTAEITVALISRRKPLKIGFSHRFIPEHDACLVRFDSFNNVLVDNIENAFKEIHEKKVSNLIIDIRKNPGGNSSSGDTLLTYLTNKPFTQFEKSQIKLSHQICSRFPSIRTKHQELKVGSLITLDEDPLIQPKDNPLRFTGRIFVLISPISGSSSTSFAAAIKCFDIGTLVGKETVDTTTCFGDTYVLRLPNSGLNANIPYKYFVLAGGKPDGRGVIPDYEVRQKPEDAVKGVDTVLQFTLNLIKKAR